SNENILSYAEELELIGLTAYDALHIACAAYAECDYFITTDKKILNKSIDRLVVVNPVEFVRKMEESYEG
ncbi:MAG: PIN domain protein, partial [Deltaproteobacteria bacterium]|nr:PIN domain protein [Deltaproteobacteria bacterium]